MKIILNNLKALCIFGVLGICVFIMGMIFFIYSESSIPIEISRVGNKIGLVLCVLSFLGYFVLHFLAGRRYMHSTDNLRSDTSSYIAISILAFLCVTRMYFPLTVLFSPGYLLSGIIGYMGMEDPRRLSLLIVAVLSILVQMLGMLSKRNIGEKAPQTPM